MTAEVSIIPQVNDVQGFKQGLASWKPKSDKEAADLVVLASLIGSKAGETALKAAKERLSRKCETCDELKFDGYTLKAVRQVTKTYGTNPQIERLRAKLEKLTQEVEETKTRLDAELSLVVTEGEKVFKYWRAV